MNPAPLLEIDDLRVEFGPVVAVDGFTLSLRPGEICGLIGPNGSGKTTTIRAILGLEPPTSGTVRVSGHDVCVDPAAARRSLAWIPDAFGLYDLLTVEETLDFLSGLYDLPEAIRRERIERALHAFSLEDLRHTPGSVLSRGVRQRVLMGKVQIHEPGVILLDEPAGGLDPRARRLLFDWLRACARGGASVLISSHVLSELTELCDSVAVLEAGRAKAVGTIAEVRDRFLPRVEVEIEFLSGLEAAETALARHPDVESVRREGRVLRLTLPFGERRISELHRAAAEVPGAEILGFRTARRDLESIFLATTEGKVT